MHGSCLWLQGLREKKLVQENLDKVDALKPIARELDCTLAQLALAWCAPLRPVFRALCHRPDARRRGYEVIRLLHGDLPLPITKTWLLSPQCILVSECGIEAECSVQVCEERACQHSHHGGHQARAGGSLNFQLHDSHPF